MNAVSTMNNLKDVISSLPSSAEKVDETFLEVYADQISSLKSIFEDKGGIHLVSVGEYDTICRLPQTEHIQQVSKNKTRDSLDIDRELLSYCLLYPSIEQVNDWMKAGKPGIISSVVRKLLELGLINSEAQTKKL